MGAKQLIQAQIDWLGSAEASKSQILIYIYACNMLDPIRAHYNRLYGDHADSEARKTSGPSGQWAEVGEEQVSIPSSPVRGVLSGVEVTRRLSEEPQASGNRRRVPLFGQELEWRGIAGYHNWFRLWRIGTTIWMVYVMVRYLLFDLFGARLISWFGFGDKLHCWLIGRLIMHDKFADLTAFLFASGHILWRAHLAFMPRPYRFTTVYFLMLGPRDLELIYSRLEPVPTIGTTSCNDKGRLGIELTFREAAKLTGRERFILETMCFKYERPTRVFYVLRSNRTAASHLELRQVMTKITLGCLALFAVTFLFLASVILIYTVLDSRYIRVYHHCDAHLQHLYETGQLGRWSMTPTWHHALTGLADLNENLILWFECGLVYIFGSAFTYIMNHDLIRCWKSIDQQINRLLVSERHLATTATDPSARGPANAPAGRSIMRDSQLGQLQAEMMDFFDQLRQADELMVAALNIDFGGWLVQTSIYIYYTQVKNLQLPSDVVALLAVIIFMIVLLPTYYLTLHRLCRRSYLPLCSLMAYDRSRSRLDFGNIIEMYVRNKTCYTLFIYPFTPTTILSTVGQSFTSYCLITGIFRERNSRHAIESIVEQASSCECPNTLRAPDSGP